MLRFSRVALKADAAKPRYLLTGGLGQLGSDLATVLRRRFGADSVVVTDVRKPENRDVYHAGPFEYCNALNAEEMDRLVVKYDCNRLVHLSAIMSVLGEAQPHRAMDLNITGVRHALECARVHKLRLFIPSTMAVFGPDAGKILTKDDTILNPTTIYGITKVFLEQTGAYYHRKFGVDFRSVRYPGIISAPQLPGGGTTDYAVHMYHYALRGERYGCPVAEHEPLPMMYVDDAVEGTVDFIEAPREKLTRCTYNIAGVSFTPRELIDSINRHLPKSAPGPLEVDFVPGQPAQAIAHSWPDSMDDSNARRDWQWSPKFDLDVMTKEMLKLIPQMHDVTPVKKAK